jgi:hypothetical protein
MDQTQTQLLYQLEAMKDELRESRSGSRTTLRENVELRDKLKMLADHYDQTDRNLERALSDLGETNAIRQKLENRIKILEDNRSQSMADSLEHMRLHSPRRAATDAIVQSRMKESRERAERQDDQIRADRSSRLATLSPETYGGQSMATSPMQPMSLAQRIAAKRQAESMRA